MERFTTVDKLVAKIFTAHENHSINQMVERHGSEEAKEAGVKAEACRELISEIGNEITDDTVKAKWFKSCTDHYRALASTIKLGLK